MDMTTKNVNQSIQSLGGEARAKAMTTEELSASGRTAALARWEQEGKRSPMPKATHKGELIIGDMEIPCAVLDNGKRVLSEHGMTNAILGSRSGASKRLKAAALSDGALLPLFLAPSVLNQFIDSGLRDGPLKPIDYEDGRNLERGYDAALLPAVCDIWLKARDGNLLQKQQLDKAKKAEILMRALAHVGIIALVDEATGFQYDRPRRDLEEQLKKFLSEELRKWVGTFPADYFKHLCRLRGVDLRTDMKLPPYFGTLTNNLIYRRIAPGLLKKLKERRAERGRPSNKLFSWLSEDVGLRALLVHVGTVVGLMKINGDYKTFERQLDQVAPIYPETPGLFDNPKDWEEPKG
jgi:hypothetical protein